MKKNKLNFLAFLCFTLFLNINWSQTTFNYSGVADTYTVPANASLISIEVSGGEGGAGNGGVGGLGATMIGTFSVSPGDVLDVIVGGAGALFNNAGGGGGGTGVIFNGNPMIIAGGGGGGATNAPGYGGLTTLDGGNSSGLGGLAGNGGEKGYKSGDCGWAGGGGGFLTDGFGGDGAWDGGTPGVAGTLGGGKSWANGGAGGLDGGCQFQPNNGAFGCGGGGAGEYAGSGGGGYSGGGGGQYTDPVAANYGGGGGGSINNGTDQTNTANNHAGDGEIIITVLCTNTPSAFSVDACASYTVPSGDETYVVSGVYNDTIPNATGCDSIMTITVSVNVINNATTIAGVTITADQVGSSYQWIDCNDNDAVIAGETNQSFTAETNGDFAVIITDNGCADTSDCVTISGVGIADDSNLGLSFYPNPTTGKVTFESSNTINLIEIYNITGQKLITFTNNTIDISELTEGIYVVKIISADDTKIRQLVKE